MPLPEHRPGKVTERKSWIHHLLNITKKGKSQIKTTIRVYFLKQQVNNSLRLKVRLFLLNAHFSKIHVDK